MKLSQIVSAYKTLGDTKVSKLEETEIIKIVKARKEMRKYVEEYEAFLKDCQDKFKPENWNIILEKVQKWQQEGDNTTLTESERIEINKALVTYQKRIDTTIKEELEKEINITIDKLKEDSLTKLLIENNWEISKLDEIEILL